VVSGIGAKATRAHASGTTITDPYEQPARRA
jgi:hypothetical protein